MAFSAVPWLSGVTPAQQAASTAMGVSGRKARSSMALEITQISVQTPMFLLVIWVLAIEK